MGDYLMSYTARINAAGTWFDDIRIEPTIKTAGSNDPSYTQYVTDGAGSIGLFAYDMDNASVAQQKEVFFSIQMPHSKKLDSAVHAHVHWTPKTAGTAGHTVKWGLEYSFANIGGTFGNSTIVYAHTPVAGSGAINVALSHCLTEFADITPPAPEGPSAILWGRLFRYSSHADDTATITVGLLGIDVHVSSERLGSLTEFA
jgi:hypothetical protein